MKPIIGIVGRPKGVEEKNIIDKQLSLCDGILMPGGYKMFAHDFYILDYAIKKYSSIGHLYGNANYV